MKTNRAYKSQAPLLAVILGTFFILGLRVPASNAQQPSWNNIEVVSENRYPGTWDLTTDLYVQDYVEPTVSFSVNGGTYLLSPLEPYSQFYPGYWFGSIIGNAGGTPLDYQGSTFTWKVQNGSETVLQATATVNGIRQVPFSENITITGDPSNPTVSWSNPDPDLDDFRIRVVDADGTLFYYGNPTFMLQLNRTALTPAL